MEFMGSSPTPPLAEVTSQGSQVQVLCHACKNPAGLPPAGWDGATLRITKLQLLSAPDTTSSFYFGIAVCNVACTSYTFWGGHTVKFRTCTMLQPCDVAPCVWAFTLRTRKLDGGAN